jgi:hypothetical protein
LPPAALEANSREHFRSLLSRARQGAGVTTFELDGDRSATPGAYSLCGRVVLNQSDLLIAIWDGYKPAGDGSTVDIALEAIEFQVPVLWIDALAPHSCQLLRDPDEMKSLGWEGPPPAARHPPRRSCRGAKIDRRSGQTHCTRGDRSAGIPVRYTSNIDG